MLMKFRVAFRWTGSPVAATTPEYFDAETTVYSHEPIAESTVFSLVRSAQPVSRLCGEFRVVGVETIPVNTPVEPVLISASEPRSRPIALRILMSHLINYDSVRFFRDQAEPGNALAQFERALGGIVAEDLASAEQERDRLRAACEAVLQFWSDHEAWGDFASLTSAAGKFAAVADQAREALNPKEGTDG